MKSQNRSTSSENFYVYVYIDPRSYQEFYYGKGQGDRKFAHLSDDGDSDKIRIIKEIRKEGLEPIIKVIARNLTEQQAFLIEKTLIWKLGRTLTNRSSGHFADNFRPHNTLHRDLHGYDFENGVYCLHIDEKSERSWEDSYKYGYISAGQNWEKWGSKICKFLPNDIVCAYVSPFGYVGIARVLEKAVPPNQFLYKGEPLSKFPLRQPWVLELKGNVRDGEFLLKVEWISTREKNDRIGGGIEFWRSRAMLGSMEDQQKTLDLLEKEFNVSFSELLSQKEKAG